MRVVLLIASLLAAGRGLAGTVTLAPETVVEWKAIYGTVEPRNDVPVRARIGGLIDELLVTEGDSVTAGQRIATVRDEKIGFQIAAYDAQIAALRSQLATAETELQRGGDFGQARRGHRAAARPASHDRRGHPQPDYSGRGGTRRSRPAGS